MIKLKYALAAMLMILCIASLTYGGQNSGASVTVDLYSAEPTTTSDMGNSSITGIGASTDVYVKVYLNNVSNAFLYSVELRIDPAKLTWAKYNAFSEFKSALTGEVNILNKEQTDLSASAAGNTSPGDDDGVYKKIKVGAYVSTNRSNYSDALAPDGSGLAAVIKLTTSSSFTTSDMAEILLKKITIEDNGQPSSTIDSVVTMTQVLGVINGDSTSTEVNEIVENTMASNTDTAKAQYQDGSAAKVAFTAGTANSGKKVTVRPRSVITDSMKTVNANYNKIEAKTATYYEVESDHTALETFTVTLSFTYTTSQLSRAGITEGSAEELQLLLAFFNSNNAWQKVTTTVDTATNTITASVTHLSVWAIVLDNPDLVPVELAALSARVDAKDGVVLEWSTVSETNNYGFYIERSLDNVTFEEIGFVKGNGTSYDENVYSYIDSDALAAGQYYYRLKQVDYDGTYEYSSIVKANIQAPSSYVLSPAYPNPFNPTTNIEFSLKESGFVKLTVYNTIGQEVVNLVNDNMDAGKHKVMFDASNLASGMYIYKINVNGFTAARKIVLMK